MQTVDPWNAIEYLFYTAFRDCGADLAHHVDTTGPQSLGEKAQQVLVKKHGLVLQYKNILLQSVILLVLN